MVEELASEYVEKFMGNTFVPPSLNVVLFPIVNVPPLVTRSRTCEETSNEPAERVKSPLIFAVSVRIVIPDDLLIVKLFKSPQLTY